MDNSHTSQPLGVALIPRCFTVLVYRLQGDDTIYNILYKLGMAANESDRNNGSVSYEENLGKSVSVALNHVTRC